MSIIDVTLNHKQSEAAALFGEYYATTGFNVDSAVAALMSDIKEHDGRLFLAETDESPQGAVAYTYIEPSIAEVRSLYVKPTYRRSGVGSGLLTVLLNQLAEEGAIAAKLYTLGSMTDAISLYKTFGFREIPPYKTGMLEGAVFMSIKLPRLKNDGLA